MAEGLSIDRLCDLLERNGYEVRLERPQPHLAKARLEGDGVSFTIYFSIDENGSFGPISFVLMWQLGNETIGLDEVNAFNARSKIAKAYVDDGYIILRHRLEIKQIELSEAIFWRSLDLWTKDIADFGTNG